MKSGIRQIVSSALLAATAVVGVLFAAQAGAVIKGSKHDFSTLVPLVTNQICIYCHAPHNGTTVTGAPLWNHAINSAQAYVLYSNSSGTLNASIGQPGGVSKLCLSCHDGILAVDSFGGRTGTTLVSGAAKVGPDLSNDHPIGFTYNAQLATNDGALVTPSSTSLVATNIPLYSGQVECATCHNVHDNTNGDFLRVSNSASALCLTCHIK